MGKRAKHKRLNPGTQLEQKPESRNTGGGLFFVEVIRWGASIALFAPLIVHPAFFFPFVVPKAVFFWMFAEIIFAAWLLLAISNKQFRPRWNAVSITLGIFLLVTIIASFTGINIERSFWSTLERMAGTVNWIHLALFFSALAFTFRTVSDWKKLLTVSFLASVFVALIFLFQKIGISIIPFDAKSGATIGNSSFMASYLLFNVFFGIWLLWVVPYSKKAIYAMGLGLVVVAVLFSTAYGAIVSMFGGFFVVFISWLFFAQKVKLGRSQAQLGRSIAILLVSVGVFLGSIVVWGTLTQNKAVISKLPYFFSDSGTIGARKVVWSMAWQGVKEKPILGFGPENFNVVFTKYFNPCLPLSECGGEVWYDRTHNTILDNLIHSGILGLFAYLSIFGAALWVVFRRSMGSKGEQGDWLFAGVFSAILLSYFVQNLLVFDMPSTYIMFAFTLALVCATPKKLFQEENREGQTRETLKSPDMRIGAIIIVVLLYSLFSFGVQSFQVAHWGIKISRGGLTASEAIRLYEKTLSASRLGNRQIVEFFTIKITDAIKQDKEQKLPLDFIHDVERIMRRTAEKNPLDFRHAIILGDLYISARSRDPEFLARGEEVLKHAIELSPTNQQGYTLLAQTYVFKKEYEKAEPLLFRAIELEQRYVNSHVALANLYELWGKDEKAQEAYKKAEELGYKRSR